MTRGPILSCDVFSSSWQKIRPSRVDTLRSQCLAVEKCHVPTSLMFQRPGPSRGGGAGRSRHSRMLFHVSTMSGLPTQGKHLFQYNYFDSSCKVIEENYSLENLLMGFLLKAISICSLCFVLKFFSLIQLNLIFFFLPPVADRPPEQCSHYPHPTEGPVSVTDR